MSTCCPVFPQEAMNKAIVSILRKGEVFCTKMNLFLTQVVKFRKALHMKTRFISLSVIFLFVFTQISAQEKKVALGLGISPTLNWMKTKSEHLSSDGTKIGFKYGLMADINFGENYALATGIFINNYGGKYKSGEGDTLLNELSVDHKIQSVAIPLTLRMRTKEIGYLKYYGQFGFSPQIIINSSADVTDGLTGETVEDKNMKDRVASFDLALVVGIGIEYNLSGTTNFIIGVSYHNGFIDMLKGTSYDKDIEKNASTNQIALNLGVLF